MASTKPKIAHDISPYLIEYTDGTIERQGTNRVPPGFDSQTGVTSKDITINPETGVSARIYQPTVTTNQKLPLVLYFHGGAFVIASPALPWYHNFCNTLVGSTNVVLISVDYRLAPEHPLPAAFVDAWAALQWVAVHTWGNGPEDLLNTMVDFHRIFLAGDSAGATLAHHISCQVNGLDVKKQVHLEGIILIHPYFWSKDKVGSETTDPGSEMVDRWWLYVCQSDEGCDDPLINPFADGAPCIDQIASDRMLVMVAENDILRERGRHFYDAVAKSDEWKGKVELYESEGKEHVFHIFDPDCDGAVDLRKKLVSFMVQK